MVLTGMAIAIMAAVVCTTAAGIAIMAAVGDITAGVVVAVAMRPNRPSKNPVVERPFSNSGAMG
jgi:hypothetical protein